MVNDMSRDSFSTLRLRLLFGRLAGLLALAGLSCQEPAEGPSAGSNWNWLMACSEDGDCQSGIACYCGGCSRECSSDADCGDLEGARCVENTENAHQSQCRAAPATSGICLPRCEPGSCADGQACVGGSCVLA